VEIKISESTTAKQLINANTRVTVLYTIGEGPSWSSNSQPIRFITLCVVLKESNSW